MEIGLTDKGGFQQKKRRRGGPGNGCLPESEKPSPPFCQWRKINHNSKSRLHRVLGSRRVRLNLEFREEKQILQMAGGEIASVRNGQTDFLSDKIDPQARFLGLACHGRAPAEGHYADQDRQEEGDPTAEGRPQIWLHQRIHTGLQHRWLLIIKACQIGGQPFAIIGNEFRALRLHSGRKISFL